MKKYILLITIICVIGGLYWGYVYYKNQKYITSAKSYKEAIYVATSICIKTADNLKYKYDNEGINLKMAGYTNEDDIRIYQMMAFEDLKSCIEERNSIILDSLLKSAYRNIDIMRKYSDSFTYEQKIFEEVLDIAKVVINKSKRGEYPLKYYRRMEELCNKVVDKLEETDITIGPLPEGSNLNIENKIKIIFTDCH